MATLHKQHEAKQGELNSVLEEKEALAKRIEGFDAERNTYIRKMAAERADVEEKANTFLVHERAKLRFNFDALERQKQNLERQLMQQNEELREAKLQAGNAKDRDINAKIEKLRAENADLGLRLEVATLESQRLTRLLDEKEDDHQDVLKLEEQFEEQTATIAAQLETIRSIDRNHRESLEQKDALEAQVVHYTATIHGLHMTVENSRCQVEQLQLELGERTQQCSVLGDRNGQLEVEIEELKAEIQTISEELSGARRLAQVSQEKLEAAMKERDDQGSKIEFLEAEQKELSRKLDKIKNNSFWKKQIFTVRQPLLLWA
jgi:chromosome segregation ATPase